MLVIYEELSPACEAFQLLLLGTFRLENEPSTALYKKTEREGASKPSSLSSLSYSFTAI